MWPVGGFGDRQVLRRWKTFTDDCVDPSDAPRTDVAGMEGYDFRTSHDADDTCSIYDHVARS